MLPQQNPQYIKTHWSETSGTKWFQPLKASVKDKWRTSRPASGRISCLPAFEEPAAASLWTMPSRGEGRTRCASAWGGECDRGSRKSLDWGDVVIREIREASRLRSSYSDERSCWVRLRFRTDSLSGQWLWAGQRRVRWNDWIMLWLSLKPIFRLLLFFWLLFLRLSYLNKFLWKSLAVVSWWWKPLHKSAVSALPLHSFKATEVLAWVIVEVATAKSQVLTRAATNWSLLFPSTHVNIHLEKPGLSISCSCALCILNASTLCENKPFYFRWLQLKAAKHSLKPFQATRRVWILHCGPTERRDE